MSNSHTPGRGRAWGYTPPKNARRMPPDKPERTKQEVQKLLALRMIHSFLSPWACSIVLMKKKSGEMRICCDFRPFNVVTSRMLIHCPGWFESLTSWKSQDLHKHWPCNGPSGKSQYKKPTVIRLLRVWIWSIWIAAHVLWNVHCFSIFSESQKF